MQLYCGKCEANYSGQESCPKCGSRLLTPQDNHIVSERAVFDLPAVNQSVASRVTTAALVALGIISGFRELLAGWLSEEWVRNDSAIIAAFGARFIAGAFGGLLAGAGREKAAPVGLMTGATAGACWFAIQIYALKIPLQTSDYFGFALLTMVSTGAAKLSVKIWPPKAELPKANLPANQSSILARAKEIEEEKRRLKPTVWPRVIFGVSMTCCAFVASPLIRDWLANGHFLELGGSKNIPFASIQITAFIAFLAAMISGAGTGIGLRQGVYTGLIAGALCGSIYMIRGPVALPAGAGIIEVMNWSVEKSSREQGAGALFGGSFIVGTIGGAFGNLLFPPISRRRNKKKKIEVAQVYAD